MEIQFRIRYKDSQAVDTGGVARDLFSVFWDIAYLRTFDGGNSLTPTVHPHMDMSIYAVLGSIISHGQSSINWIFTHLNSFSCASSLSKGS